MISVCGGALSTLTDTICKYKKSFSIGRKKVLEWYTEELLEVG